MIEWLSHNTRGNRKTSNFTIEPVAKPMLAKQRRAKKRRIFIWLGLAGCVASG
jgi:hypothetical protein